MTSENEPPSRIQITGKNALVAVGIAFLLVLLLSFVHSMMWMALNITDTAVISVRLFFDVVAAFFKVVGVCVGPIVFFLAFALLQRVRLR